MAAVNMDFIHFYQPPINTRLPGEGDGRPTGSDIPIVGGEDPNSTAFRPSHEPSGTFPDEDAIETIDLTASFNPSREQTPDLQDLEANVGNKSNGLWTFLEHIRRDREGSIEFPTLEELLFSTRGHASDSSAEEQDEEQYSLDTQPTSVSSSETGCTTLRRNPQGIPETPSPCPDGLPLATPGKQTGSPNSGGGEDPEPYAAVKDSQDRWNNERAEVDHKAEAEEEEEEGGEEKKEEPQEQDGEPASKVRGRSSPAEFIDPYGNFPEDLVKWLREESVSKNTNFSKQGDDSSSKAQDRGGCKGNPIVIEDNCDRGSSSRDLEKSEPSSSESNGDPIDPVNPSAPTPGSRRHGNNCGDLDSRSRVHTSNSSTSEEQRGTQGSLSPPPTSVAGSEAGYPALPESKDDPISDLPPSPRSILLSLTHGEVNDEVTGESSSGGCRDIESAYSAGEDVEDEAKGDEWEVEKAEADEGVVQDRDGNKTKTSLLSSTKKRGRSATGERPPSQRRRKRRRFSSPLSSDDETESDDESVISRYTPSKPYHVLIPRPTSSRLSRSERDFNNGKVKLAGSQSCRRPIPKTTVIYERQSWEGGIIEEREVKQGRGRPRKQYLIRSWVDGARLRASELLHTWTKEKASKGRR